MTRNRFPLASAGLLALVAMPALSRAGTIDLRRDSVVPVVFEDTLTIRNTRQGDRFSARVEDDRYLPSGSRLEGRVVGIRESRREDPAMMDLEFNTVILPDGSRERIDAVPIPLTDRYVTRGRDGRFTVNRSVKKKEGYVLGGMVGGFILGSIFHKQLEGTVLGAIAGIVLAESDKGNDGNTVISRGQRMGALVNRDFRINWRNDRRDDRWDRRDENDRWDNNRNDDWRRDDRRDDRREDRWGNGNDSRYEARDTRISVGNRDITFSNRERPYREDITLMVPLERTASQMNMRISRDEFRSDRYIFVDGTDGYLQLELGTREAKLNGRRITIAQPPVERDGVVYVPFEVLVQVSRDTVYMNGTRMTRRYSY